MNRIIDRVYLSDRSAARDIRRIIGNEICLIISIGCEKIDVTSSTTLAKSFLIGIDDDDDASSFERKEDLVAMASAYLSTAVTIVEYPYIVDQPDVLISAIFNETEKLITEFVSNNKNVLVHCMHGQSRSVAVLANYLMAHSGSIGINISLEDAILCIKQSRPDICINPGFLSQLYTIDRCRTTLGFLVEYKLASFRNPNLPLIVQKFVHFPEQSTKIESAYVVDTDNKVVPVEDSTALLSLTSVIKLPIVSAATLPNTNALFVLHCKYCRTPLCDDSSVLHFPESPIVRQYNNRNTAISVVNFNEFLRTCDAGCGEDSMWSKYPLMTSKICKILPQSQSSSESSRSCGGGGKKSLSNSEKPDKTYSNAFVVAPTDWMSSLIISEPCSDSLSCPNLKCKKKCGGWKEGSLALFHGYVQSYYVVLNLDAVDISFCKRGI